VGKKIVGRRHEAGIQHVQIQVYVDPAHPGAERVEGAAQRLNRTLWSRLHDRDARACQPLPFLRTDVAGSDEDHVVFRDRLEAGYRVGHSLPTVTDNDGEPHPVQKALRKVCGVL